METYLEKDERDTGVAEGMQGHNKREFLKQKHN
jgi:hypothetical protein